MNNLILNLKMTSSMKRRDVYLNPMQQRIYYTNARDVRLLASRRFGKTDGSIGPRIYRVSLSMPRATNIWLGNSRKQLYTRTVPGTIAAIERFYGLREGTHFGWGKPPRWVPEPIIKPKSWENVIWFANGTIWQLISLAVTGSANSITANSIVADECKFMSKSKIDGEVMAALSGIVHPLGNPAFSEENPLYKSTFFASDASLTVKGNWLEKEEEKLDQHPSSGPFSNRSYREIQAELTNYAERIMFYNELLRNAQKDGCVPIVLPAEQIAAVKVKAEAMMNHEGPFRILPNYGHRINKAMLTQCINYNLISPDEAELLFCHKYLITPEQDFDMQMINESKSYKKHIAELQRYAFCFWRATTLDNVDLLGKEYIERMKRDLPPIVFAISILNLKQAKSNDGFYSNLDIENIHGYIPDDCPAIDSSIVKRTASTVHGGQQIDTEYETPDFGELQKLKDCTLDGDVVDNLPLYIAMDYNANINWIVTGQLYQRDKQECLNVISSMFVKNERKLRELCGDWHHYYKPKMAKCRDVVYFYNATAKFRGYAVEGMEDFKDVVINTLTLFGWNVIAIDMRAPMAHEIKYKDINESLAGCAYPAIRFNRENNEALIVAMQSAEVSIGYKGFRKNKAGEKLSEDADDAVRLEYRTDGTDAFDDLYIGVRYHLNNLSGMCMPIPE
ncbi:hypothetical protein [Prevotella sp. MGM1]|uniref:hypothetical protein n=1 Tax=Prevotella sp. MGM1 TaxID=2033405 RepID=UPI001304B1B3|nr:hypothetical protein [Prevotella sp. MGM1]